MCLCLSSQLSQIAFEADSLTMTSISDPDKNYAISAHLLISSSVTLFFHDQSFSLKISTLSSASGNLTSIFQSNQPGHNNASSILSY